MDQSERPGASAIQINHGDGDGKEEEEEAAVGGQTSWKEHMNVSGIMVSTTAASGGSTIRSACKAG